MVYEDFCKPEGHCRVLHATKGISMALEMGTLRSLSSMGYTNSAPTRWSVSALLDRRDDLPYHIRALGEDYRHRSRQSRDSVRPRPPECADIDNKFDQASPHWHHDDKDYPEDRGVSAAAICNISRRPGPQRHVCTLRRLVGADTTSALHFTTKWCCDRHPGIDFHMRAFFFKGRLLYQDPST
ncbi:hypothetical protein EDB83DRAFT_49925 [Lactarius deliciosus]|nr:hypothetical protein EDB83DRAFT_49925 [Lactarius deliciosus]